VAADASSKCARYCSTAAGSNVWPSADQAASFAFEANMVPADTPLPLYTQRRRTFHHVMQKEMRGGDDPAVIARVIVAAATDRKPELRRPAGSTAARISVLRRIVPARTFDRSVRKLNRMPS
jgi:hypothetical protein